MPEDELTIFKRFPFTPPTEPVEDYHVMNRKYCHDRGVRITYSDTAPTSPAPENGDIWIDTSDL